jgi:hypothetical protein
MHINPQTQTPITPREIRALHPNTTIGPNADFAALGYPEIEPVPRSEPGEGEIVRKGAPEQYEPGKWRETWTIDAAPPPPVPQEVSRLQARLALISIDKWDITKAYFEEPERTAEEVAFFEDATVYRRDNPVMIAAAESVGVTETELDELFRLAVTL